MDVTVLCDAVAVFPELVGEALPGWGPEWQGWTERMMPGNVAVGGGWWLHFHSYLVTDEGWAVLVDAGVGPAGGEAAEWLGVEGRLPRLLGQVDVKPEEIDAVVLTHVHLDHAGWNVEAAGPRFSNADYVVQRVELEHVRGSETYERSLRPVLEAGQLRVVDGETELQGTRLLPTPGHTPGHQSVLTSRAILGGDVLVHPAQAHWPEIRYVYERDPVAAVASRREVLALAAAQGIPVAAAHPHVPLDAEARPLPPPGPGHQPCPPYQLNGQR